MGKRAVSGADQRRANSAPGREVEWDIAASERQCRYPVETRLTMSKSDDEQRIIFRENAIRVGAGFVAKERPHVLDSLSTLGPHLGRWDPRDVDIDVSLQDRGGNEQRITLRTSCPALRRW